MPGALLVHTVNFDPKENARHHKTNNYEVLHIGEPTIIVRRGQPFRGVISFTRPYDEANDVVQLVFTMENQSSMETMGKMLLRRQAPTDKLTWSANLVEIRDANTIYFDVSSPVTAPVGVWKVQVITWRKGSKERPAYKCYPEIYILFNPWNPDDQTYMTDTQLLQEYVLSDVGKVWRGPGTTAYGTPWFYGQFDAVVLPACMLMLKRAKVPYKHRGDPVKVSRAISRIVNAADHDHGVLVGRWDGHYQAGTSPFDWTGSVDILAQFLETGRSVYYGQCWVFAGIVTTVCRALGIPARTVSNMVSAHDTNNTLSIDKYYSETMQELDYDPNNENPYNKDSIWNYHAWNDVWMARPDLIAGYGGWQAIDATPQELSEGWHQCGPAPLEAIKKGIIGLSYDVEFVLASVNADFMRWRVDHEEDTGYSVVDTDAYHIGRAVLTKKPYVFDPNGDEDREDITDQYKFKEGTASERLALKNGVKFSERAKRFYSMVSRLQYDVKFQLRDLDFVPIGKDFTITIDIENNSTERRHIKASLFATSTFYNGIRANLIKKVEGKMLVGASKKEKISIVVKSEEYLPKLVEYCIIKISAIAVVDETNQAWADDDDFQVLKPTIGIKFDHQLLLNQPAVAYLFFTNPLEHILTGCEFRLTSSSILGRTLIVPADNVDPLGQAHVNIPITPNKLGTINFVATFKSVELVDIRGAATREILQ